MIQHCIECDMPIHVKADDDRLFCDDCLESEEIIGECDNCGDLRPEAELKRRGNKGPLQCKRCRKG